jgi:hypothetical protein
MSAWIEHIKDYAKQKEMKYTEAMKDPQCKELYHKNKSPVDKKKIDEMTRPKVSIQMEKVDKPKTSKAKKEEKITHEEMNAPMISMNTIDKVLKLKPPKKEGNKKKT